MRTKATSLSIRPEKITAFKFALEYQKIDSYKRLELQTKELSTRSFSCSSLSFAGSFTRFVRSFSPASTRQTVYVSGLLSCSSVCPVLLAIHEHKHVISCIKTLRRSSFMFFFSVMLQRKTSSFSDLTQIPTNTW